MIALLALAAVSATPAYVDCSLADADGNSVRWQIALNEAEGTADVTIGDQEPQRLKATFYPESVRFYVGVGGPIPADVRHFAASLPGMRMELSRIDLRVARYSNGEGNPPNYGQCRLATPKKTRF